jgi:transposase
VSLQQASERMCTFYQELAKSDPLLFVQDSAGYDACVSKEQTFLWLSRVPETHKRVKEMITQKDEDVTWGVYEKGYKGFVQEITYKNVKQRWALIFSKQAYDREVKTLEKNIQKEKEKLTKRFAGKLKHKYGCAQDALIDLKKFKKTMKYHAISDETTEEILGYKGKGRPKDGQEKEVIHVLLKGTLTQDDNAIETYTRQKGRFILATNQLDREALKDEDILKTYKAQSQTEQGFHFIKDNAFEVSSIFLKKPSRINALMMIMTLCLMVYNVAQHQLRNALETQNLTVPTQTHKQTQKPTMRWICQLFGGVSVAYITLENKVHEVVANVQDILKVIIRLFGKKACLIYGVENEA